MWMTKLCLSGVVVHQLLLVKIILEDQFYTRITLYDWLGKHHDDDYQLVFIFIHILKIIFIYSFDYSSSKGINLYHFTYIKHKVYLESYNSKTVNPNFLLIYFLSRYIIWLGFNISFIKIDSIVPKL